MLLLFACAAHSQEPSAGQTLASFELAEGLEIALVASEPLTASPCAMAFDERGRLFVAENRGYPIGPREGEPAAGIIAMLEDLDGDGRMDRRTVFAEGLGFPNGVLPWKGGLLVTCAPDLIYLRDIDGDGRADERTVLLTGFDISKSTQLRVNAPTLGPDGAIWLASGLSGGRISNPAHPEFGTMEMKSDLRFEPETGRFEPVDGRSQYGQSFDEFGRRFICMNRIPVQHVVFPFGRRTPLPGFSETVQNCPDLVPNPLLRGGGGGARIFPISHNLTTADSHAGTFSAACGVMIWRGGALPETYAGSALACDPTGNVVHAERLEARGATFGSTPVFNDHELLASRDDWFRPVFLSSGPDGALYICDMTRKVIEHPDYLPEEVRKHTDFEAGKALGRIWRVRKKTGAGPDASTAVLAKSGGGREELFKALGSPNGWSRQNAFRRLVEQRETLTSKEVAAVLGRSESVPETAAALHLLRLVSTDAAVEPAALRAALSHPNAGIREMALALFPGSIRGETLGAALLVCANDPAERVRFQCALTAGNLSDSVLREKALGTLALHPELDRWSRAAIEGSAAGLERQLIRHILESSSATPSLSLLKELAGLLFERTPKDARASVLEELLDKPAQPNPPIALALAAGFARELPGPAQTPGLLSVFDQAREALAKSASAEVCLLAIEVLGATDISTGGPALIAALDNGETATRAAAIRALARMDDAAPLLDAVRWQTHTPALREAVLNAVLSRPRLTTALLAAIENHAIPAAAIDSSRRRQLLKNPDPALRARAEKLLESPASGDRLKAFENAKAVLSLAPHPENGHAVFLKLCASCHRMEREGIAVGPDLLDIRNQPKENILLHIVVPEFEIAPGFSAYGLETRDGRSFSGILIGENEQSVTLRQPGGQEESVPREQIAKLTASELSLMPQGLESAMSSQDLADLLAWLRGER